LTHDINFEATVALARRAKEAGVRRFIFASSCSMYGGADTDAYVTEEAPLRPLTSYAESKVRAEEALAKLAGDGFSPVLMRNATAYGVSPRLRFDVVLNNLVGWAFTTGKVKIMSDGTPWRPIVHVEDIARVTLLLLEANTEVVHNQAFNVGANEENYQVSELAEIAKDVVPGAAIEYSQDAGPDRRSYRVDFSKLVRTFPDVRLKWTARAGAEELVAAFREIGLTLEDFESPRFTRLKQLRLLVARGLLDGEFRSRATSGVHAVRVEGEGRETAPAG
jgi:nucleoside-diphosphate-sugar epimerase